MTCNDKCIHFPVCEQKKYDFANIDECRYYEEVRPHGKPTIIESDKYKQIDKQEIQKSVHLLDLFTKTYCRYVSDYERFEDLKFRCDECPFQKEDGFCQVKEFKNRYAPDYKDFGSMGDL